MNDRDLSFFFLSDSANSNKESTTFSNSLNAIKAAPVSPKILQELYAMTSALLYFSSNPIDVVASSISFADNLSEVS